METNTTEMTVEELKTEVAEISSVEQLEQLMEQEREGDDRKTAKAAIAGRVAELQEAEEEDGSEEDETDEEPEEEDEPEEDDSVEEKVLGWEEAPHQLKTRLAFMQETVNRTFQDDAPTIEFGADDVMGYWEDGETLVMTEAGLRTGQDRDHKTQWMHQLLVLLDDTYGIPHNVQLEILGDVEYEGLTATLGHLRDE